MNMSGRGFLDVQVNGAFGVDFNDPATTPEQIHSMLPWFWSNGVVKFCPTVITNSPEATARLLENIVQAREADLSIRNSIPCIHLEGPFISMVDGPRGCHRKEFVRAPNWDEFRRFQDAASGLIKLVTLAPEWPEAPSCIQRLTDAKVVVSIGHTNANPRQIMEAVKAGAKFSTHLGNGIGLMQPRHDNPILMQLANSALMLGLIADGHHLPQATLGAFIKIAGLGRCVLVSDSMPVAGKDPGRYEWAGQRVEVRPSGFVSLIKDGADSGLLAGSVLNLKTAVENTAKLTGVSILDAMKMAGENPARLMGLALQGCEVEFECTDHTIEVLRTTVNTRVVFEKK